MLAVLAAVALVTIGQAPAAAAGTPSSANSTISVNPNPMLISEPDGSPSFEATVTVKDADGDPVSGDPVTLAVSDGGLGGGMLGSISENPQETDSEGKATFSFTCNAGYCYAGAALEVTASDPSGLSLGPVIEYVSEIAFAGRSYAGQTDTLKIQDLAGAETKDKPVTLSLDGSSVALSGACATDSTGSLPLPGDVGACTFTVPAVQPPSGEFPPANVPAVVTVGAQAFDVSFPLQPAPALQLQPTSGPAGSTVLVGGTGFPQEKGVRVLVRFTPHGSGAASTGINCQTDGLGGIEDEATGAGCRLVIPADSPEGAGEISAEEYDSLTEYATATATFTVEPPKIVGIELSDNYPGCPGGPPAGPTCSTGVHDELYLGETAGLAILSVWNTGTTELLKVPAGGPEPVVSWSSEPQPSGAIALNGVNAAGNDIGLTAGKVTSAPGIVQAEYEGFKATSESLGAVVKPCEDCSSINGALLNVKAQVPGLPNSTPVSGATANITQGVGGAPVFTSPPVCIPDEGICAGTGYPELEASATETCTTENAGACQLIAGEGTEGVASEIEDTVTLTPPAGYTVTGIGGECTSKSGTGPYEAPVCHLRLGELSNPRTITYELERLPELTVKVGGPEVALLTWANGDVDGAVATITPVDGTPGKPVECTVEGGEEEEPLTSQFFAAQASCGKVLEPGTYEVLVGPKFTTAFGKYSVTSEDPKKVTLKAGEQSPVSFNTVEEHETELIVKVGGPEIELLNWENADVDGAVATITPIDGTPGEAVECTVAGGEYEDVLSGELISDQASCGKVLEPGTYEVSVGPKITTSYGSFYVTSEDPQKVTLKAGEQGPVSFNTASEYPLTSVMSGRSTESSIPAEVKDGALTATASGGTGTVTVGRYESDPVGVPTFYSSGQYVDVFLAPGSTFTSLSFTDCELGGGTGVYWWNPKPGSGNGEWPFVSDETEPSGTPPCITITIDEDTSPSLKQMTGTVFGVALPPASASPSTLPTSLPPASMTPPATTAATGSVSLEGSTIPVKGGDAAEVKLTCTGTATCAGELTLTAKSTTKKGKKQHSKTQTIGTAGFSIPAGSTTTVKLTLGAAGKALLKAAHGRLSASLKILEVLTGSCRDTDRERSSDPTEGDQSEEGQEVARRPTRR